MYGDISPEDLEKVRQLGLITQELLIEQEEWRRKRAVQRRLAVDLIQREVISQARASRITEVQRQTISSWLQADFEGRAVDDS